MADSTYRQNQQLQNCSTRRKSMLIMCSITSRYVELNRAYTARKQGEGNLQSRALVPKACSRAVVGREEIRAPTA
jgi:hypothetical protein